MYSFSEFMALLRRWLFDEMHSSAVTIASRPPQPQVPRRPSPRPINDGVMPRPKPRSLEQGLAGVPFMDKAVMVFVCGPIVELIKAFEKIHYTGHVCALISDRVKKWSLAALQEGDWGQLHLLRNHPLDVSLGRHKSPAAMVIALAWIDMGSRIWIDRDTLYCMERAHNYFQGEINLLLAPLSSLRPDGGSDLVEYLEPHYHTWWDRL